MTSIKETLLNYKIRLDEKKKEQYFKGGFGFRWVTDLIASHKNKSVRTGFPWHPQFPSISELVRNESERPIKTATKKRSRHQ